MKLSMYLAGIGVFMLLPFLSIAQKKVISLPFEFEKSKLAGDYDSHFLNNERDSNFSLVLKDKKKVQYLLIDKNFKVLSTIDLDLKSTVFNNYIMEYRGGTTNGNIYHYSYEETDNKRSAKATTVFHMESIDYNSKTVKHQDLFEVPKAEKLLSSFSDNNIFYTVTADDKSGELVIYSVNEAGLFKSNRIPFSIPASAGKRRDKVSTYFSNLQVIKDGEEPDLSAAVSTTKLFPRPGILDFVINEEGKPAHIFSVRVPAFSSQEKFIDFAQFNAGGKDEIMVNSFIMNDRLFSFILDRKKIRITVHEMSTGKLQNKFEINEASSFGMFAKYPVSDTRAGKLSDEKAIDDTKKLIKALYDGSRGVMVNENKKGQIIVTVGTYDLISMSSGGSMPEYTAVFRPPTPAPGSVQAAPYSYSPTWQYRPGRPSYTTRSSRYYKSSYFKLLLDSTGSVIEKGKVGVPPADQIKDYMELVDPKVKATNQFSIGDRQFFGYYDDVTKAYVVEEIKIRK